MPSNTSVVDAISRAIVALGLFALSVAFRDLYLLSLSVALAAIVLLVTALTRTCPVYRALGISTRQRRDRRGRQYKEKHGKRAPLHPSGAPLGANPGAHHRQ